MIDKETPKKVKQQIEQFLLPMLAFNCLLAHKVSKGFNRQCHTDTNQINTLTAKSISISTNDE